MTAAITQRIAEASPSAKARTAGALSFFAMVAAISGESLFPKFEAAGDNIALSALVIMTALLYFIFRPVNRPLSLIAAFCNLAGLLSGALRWNPHGIDTPVVCAGFYSLLIASLIFRSTFLPRFLAPLMAIAGLGWLTYLSPTFAAHLSPWNLAAAILGQQLVMLWLLVKGVKNERWQQQASPWFLPLAPQKSSKPPT